MQRSRFSGAAALGREGACCSSLSSTAHAHASPRAHTYAPHAHTCARAQANASYITLQANNRAKALHGAVFDLESEGEGGEVIDGDETPGLARPGKAAASPASYSPAEEEGAESKRRLRSPDGPPRKRRDSDGISPSDLLTEVLCDVCPRDAYARLFEDTWRHYVPTAETHARAVRNARASACISCVHMHASVVVRANSAHTDASHARFAFLLARRNCSAALRT